MKKLKIYSVNDGRTDYAVAATSRVKAVELFNSAHLVTTVYDQTKSGDVWPAGEREDYAVIEASPGMIFEAPVSMRDDDAWRLSRRFQTDAGRAALQTLDSANSN